MKKTILFLSVLLVSINANAIEYEIIDLGTLDGMECSTAYAINDNSQIVGYSYYSTGTHPHAFLYENGSIRSLGSLGGDTIGYDINNNGDIVGSDTIGQGPFIHRSFIYTQGSISNLGINGGACGINTSGQIVGDGGFLYENGSITHLGNLGGDYCEAYKINECGQVVGYSKTNTGERHAFLYENGLMSDLGTLGGDYSRARNINNAGLIVGFSTNAFDLSHAFLYENDTMIDLGTLGGNSSQAEAINDNGIIVGWSELSPGDSTNYYAFCYMNDTMYNLNDLISPDSGWVLRSASDINNLGQIVGWGFNGDAFAHAFLMTPIPEPASLLILALGGIALRYRRS